MDCLMKLAIYKSCMGRCLIWSFRRGAVRLLNWVHLGTISGACIYLSFSFIICINFSNTLSVKVMLIRALLFFLGVSSQ